MIRWYMSNVSASYTVDQKETTKKPSNSLEDWSKKK